MAVMTKRGFLVLFWLVVVAVGNDKTSVTMQLEKKQERMRRKRC